MYQKGKSKIGISFLPGFTFGPFSGNDGENVTLPTKCEIFYNADLSIIVLINGGNNFGDHPLFNVFFFILRETLNNNINKTCSGDFFLSLIIMILSVRSSMIHLTRLGNGMEFCYFSPTLIPSIWIVQ